MKEVFIETLSGEYRLGLDGMTIKKAYLRSNRTSKKSHFQNHNHGKKILQAQVSQRNTRPSYHKTDVHRLGHAPR